MTTRKDATREELLQAIDTLREALEELSFKEYPAVGFRMDRARQALSATDALKKE